MRIVIPEFMDEPAVAALTVALAEIMLESGEKAGWLSYAAPCVMRLAVPPLIGSVYRSPSRSNRSVPPSFETSTESQVPSSVENSILLV